MDVCLLWVLCVIR